MMLYTPAQEEAISKSKSLLAEHFDGYVIIVGTEIDERSDQGNSQEQADVLYGGGWLRALGLMKYANRKADVNFT